MLAGSALGACGVGRATEDSEVRDDPSGAAFGDELVEARQELFLGVTWDRIDERLRQRAETDGLTTAALVVGTDPATSDSTATYGMGEVGPATTVSLGETSFWFTASTLLTLVDDGTLVLDQAIGDRLPDLGAAVGAITLRQLLSHTSGLPRDLACPEATVAACDAALATTPLTDPPGEAFAVTDADAHVAARLAEAVTGRTWPELFAERIAAPTGLEATAYAAPDTTGGLLAVDGATTVGDLGRFLSMIRDGGRADDGVVLSETSLEQMLLDQTARLDTHTEPWVAATGVPTYGFGVWRDRLRGDDAASVVSAPNRWGLYPFVDDARGAWGIVVVEDRAHPLADVVAASSVLAQLTSAALRRPPD